MFPSLATIVCCATSYHPLPMLLGQLHGFGRTKDFVPWTQSGGATRPPPGGLPPLWLQLSTLWHPCEAQNSQAPQTPQENKKIFVHIPKTGSNCFIVFQNVLKCFIVKPNVRNTVALERRHYPQAVNNRNKANMNASCSVNQHPKRQHLT